MTQKRCKPWRGEFDLDTNMCMKNGKPYMVGHRSCKHADCVEETHILDEVEYFLTRQRDLKALMLEQFDRSYTTRRKLSWSQWINKIESERFANSTKGKQWAK